MAVAQPAGSRSRRRHSADRFGSRERGVRHRKPPQVRAPAEDRIVQGPWRAGRGAESGDSAKNSSGHLCRAGQDRGSRLATALRVPPLAGSRCPGVASTCDPRSARRWVMAGVRPIPAAGRQRKPGADRSRTAGPFVLVVPWRPATPRPPRSASSAARTSPHVVAPSVYAAAAQASASAPRRADRRLPLACGAAA